MRLIPTKRETISLSNIAELPRIDLIFTTCRVGPDGYLFDILDLSKKSMERWPLPSVHIPRASDKLKRTIPAKDVPFGVSHEDYLRDYLMGVHVSQLSRDNKLFVSMGEFYNGFYVIIIDTMSNQACIFPDDFEKPLMQYASTGSFTADGRYWMFIRWPFEDSLDIARGRREEARCEIGRIRLSDLESEIIYRLDTIDRIHQLTCSPDGRYAVFSPFQWNMNLPYPNASIEEDPEGYRRSNRKGMKKDALVTVDLESGRHWRTEIPVPVPAHFEIDPVDPSVFYLSSHHFHPINGNVIVEGPACLFKMRIRDGETMIEGQYSDEQFFRMSQHMPFVRNGKVLVAVTNLPNKLDLIDAETMTLWRRVELFPAEDVDRSRTGNFVCPVYPESCFAINPSKDGKYVVLESPKGFPVYDLEKDRLLKTPLPKYLPEGTKWMGHTRLAFK